MQVNAGTSGSASLTITVCKNAATGATISGATVMTITLPAGTTTKSFYAGSVNFAPPDTLHVYYAGSDSGWYNVSVQVDCF